MVVFLLMAEILNSMLLGTEEFSYDVDMLCFSASRRELIVGRWLFYFRLKNFPEEWTSESVII